jgi:ribosomal-protein-alanine N-acetyltransferase
MSRAETEAAVARYQAHLAAHGFCMWAVEVPGTTPFAGVIGLQRPSFEAHFTPCVEIGWRLEHTHWGKGYATEGARRALAFAFEDLGLEEIVAMTAIQNARSRHVMDKLGMRYVEGGDFDHPRVPEQSPVRRHVLYTVRRRSG